MTDSNNLTGSMLAMLRAPAMTAGWWLIVIAITAGTNALDFFTVIEHGAQPTLPFLLSIAVRIALVFWLGYALLRHLAGIGHPWKIGWPLARYTLFAVGTLAVAGLALGLVKAIAGPDADRLISGVAGFLFVTIVFAALVRLLAWQTALAIGDRSMGPAKAWRTLAGDKGALVRAYLLVAVVSALHSLLTASALGYRGEPLPLAAFALVDGVVSAIQLVMTCALSVLAYRLVVERSEALREGMAVA